VDVLRFARGLTLGVLTMIAAWLFVGWPSALVVALLTMVACSRLRTRVAVETMLFERAYVSERTRRDITHR
jgi:uncharacterized membrane protein